MKIKTLIALIILLLNNAQAQNFCMGVRAGFSRNTVSQDFATYSSKDAITGLSLGAYGKIKAAGFFIMPEINYNQRGNSIEGFGTSTIHNIDVPVLFGKQFFKTLRLNAGPNFQFMLANTQTAQSTYLNQSTFNNFVLGLQLGIGVDVWKLSFDARYDMNLSEAGVVKYTDPRGLLPAKSFDSRANMFIFTVGYKLFELP